MINLKNIRNSHKISQQSLADKIGVSRSTVAMWETGGSQPDNDMLEVLANFFNVSTDEILGRQVAHVNNDAELSEYLEDLRTRPELKMLFQLSRNASKEDVEKAVTIIETLLK